MSYMTAARLQSLMGTYDYNNTLNVSNGAAADASTVAAVIQRSDDYIDRYHTNLTTDEKESVSDDITPFFAYLRRGPGNVPQIVRMQWEEATNYLKQNQGIRCRPTYDPLDLPEQDYLDDTVADPQ